MTAVTASSPAQTETGTWRAVLPHALPFLGIPVFGFLWWFGMRRQGGAPDGETELMEHRREPNLEKAAAAPTRGRREPTL